MRNTTKNECAQILILMDDLFLSIYKMQSDLYVNQINISVQSCSKHLRALTTDPLWYEIWFSLSTLSSPRLHRLVIFNEISEHIKTSDQ